MIKTYVLDTNSLRVPEKEQEWPRMWADVLSAQRMEKICRIKNIEAQKQSLGAGLLLHHCLYRKYPDAVMTHGICGKPVCAQIPFNLSHTKGAVILSIWEQKDAAWPFAKEESGVFLGCDIEQIMPYKPRIARRFFTEAEYNSIEAVKDPQEQAMLFCRYWTRKESVMKLTGLGLALPMDLYDVRNQQAAADSHKIDAWLEKEAAKGQLLTEYQQAAYILRNKKLYFQQYRYQNCYITVCSFLHQFAQELEEYRTKTGGYPAEPVFAQEK